MEDELVVIKVSELIKLVRYCVREEMKFISTPSSLPEILDTDDVAALLKLSKGQIINLRKEKLPHFYIGSSIRYKRDEILKYLDTLKKPQGTASSIANEN
jgi:hypothetical protein